MCLVVCCTQKHHISTPTTQHKLTPTNTTHNINAFKTLLRFALSEMEAQLSHALHLTSWVPSGKIGRKPTGSVQFSQRFKDRLKQQVLLPARLQPTGVSKCHGLVSLDVSCLYKKTSAPILECGRINSPCDEALVLKEKSQEIEPIIDGRSIYLVGMMGSGKTTVGKILSKELGYSFCDIDTLIEQDIGTSVAEIFKLYGEGLFREKESEALKRTCLNNRLVVSTGGGAVVRPVNWRFMQKGISIWLDVPLEALARRIVAVGTNSRPLLHQELNDPYKQTYLRLCNLMEERGEAYANASARVSLENIAAKTGKEDICDISPTAIAIEALEQIGLVLKGVDSSAIQAF